MPDGPRDDDSLLALLSAVIYIYASGRRAARWFCMVDLHTAGSEPGHLSGRAPTNGGVMTVGEICNRDVVIIGKEATIPEAAKLMREHHVGNLLVVEDRRGQRVPIGIVTDRDLVVEVLALGVSLDSVAVVDVMTMDLVTARENDGIWETLQRMRTRGVRRMPVVNDQDGLVGILAVDDLLELLADELSALAKVGNREQQREKETRTKP
jgi:CBS domain-containing protein